MAKVTYSCFKLSTFIKEMGIFSSKRPRHPGYMMAAGDASDEGENSIDEFFTKSNGVISPEVIIKY